VGSELEIGAVWDILGHYHESFKFGKFRCSYMAIWEYNLLLNLQISIQNSETLNKTELYVLQHCGAFGCVLHGNGRTPTLTEWRCNPLNFSHSYVC
jgi:hypothetical protein